MPPSRICRPTATQQKSEETHHGQIRHRMPALREVRGSQDGLFRPQEDRLRLRLHHQRPHGQNGQPHLPPLWQQRGLRPVQGGGRALPRLRRGHQHHGRTDQSGGVLLPPVRRAPARIARGGVLHLPGVRSCKRRGRAPQGRTDSAGRPCQHHQIRGRRRNARLETPHRGFQPRLPAHRPREPGGHLLPRRAGAGRLWRGPLHAGNAAVAHAGKAL